jgi:hypothetical protein
MAVTRSDTLAGDSQVLALKAALRDESGRGFAVHRDDKTTK